MPGAGLEPARPKARDFKSLMSANSIIPAHCPKLNIINDSARVKHYPVRGFTPSFSPDFGPVLGDVFPPGRTRP